MPRKSFRRSTRRRRPTVSRRTQKIRSLAGQRPITAIEHLAGYGRGIGTVAKAVSTIYGLVNSEAKFVDTSLTGTLDIAGTGYAIAVTSIAEGDDNNQRNGRKVLYKNLDLKYFVQNQNTAVPSVCSMALVMDTKPDAGTCDWSNVFATADEHAPLNLLLHAGRFVILHRKFFCVEPLNAGNPKSTICYKAHINLKGIHEQFDGTAATNFEKNPIFLLGITNNNSSPPVVQGTARLTYYDN